jgi:anti-sigma regulatory factor (Ser/Thr protein kinase)
VDRVVEAVQRLSWSAMHLEQLKLALAQAARKAMEYSYRYDSEAPLVIRVLIPEDDPAPREVDPANAEPPQFQASEREPQPVGQPPSRGWGFFFIERALPDPGGAGWHLLELFLYPGGK